MGRAASYQAIAVRVGGASQTSIDAYNGTPAQNIISGSTASSFMPIGSWHHLYLSIYNNENNKMQGEVYIDGVLCYQGHGNNAKNTATNYSPRINGCEFEFNWRTSIGGYISSLRVYNRALIDVEIAALASEFTPST